MIFVIHNQKLAFETKESEEKYRSIFNNSISGILLIDEKGCYLDVNPQFTNISGYSYAEMLHKPVGLIAHPEDVERILNFMKELLTQKIVTVQGQFRVIHKNGRTIWLQLNATTNFKQDGTFDFILLEAYDITLQKIAEQDLKESEAKLRGQVVSKDKFMTILAHDLKSPFNGILGFTDLLLENLHGYTLNEIENHLKLIKTSSYKTYRLLEDLLLWSQSQSGKILFQPEQIETQSFFAEIISQKQLIAEAKKINLRCDLPENLSIFADPNMLKTILRNLISNAIKYTHEMGEVNIKVEKTQEKVTVVISDSGVGIEKENLAKLWDMSFLYSTTGTAGEKGTGFGLLLCKDFVERHGGEIWVESEIGRGSDFKFTLPQDKA
jgi:PAS domain S-box-containing protein